MILTFGYEFLSSPKHLEDEFKLGFLADITANPEDDMKNTFWSTQKPSTDLTPAEFL